MNYMSREVQEELKNDIQNGKIWGLKLIKTDIEAIKGNYYAEIFGVARPIVRFDKNCFYLSTRLRNPQHIRGGYDGKNYSLPDCSIPDFKYEECEAYYEAFNYYDGHVLKSFTDISNSVNKEDSVLINEYEVIRSY